MQAVILAAGRGKRLHPITAKRTKAMAPILGKPIVERVMEPLVENGIQSFILVVSPEDQEIHDHFLNRSSINAEVTLVDQTEALGMGHALLQAASMIQGDFILSACDNLVEINEINQLLQFWKIQKPEALLTTIPIPQQDISRMGIIELKNDQVIRIIEKPSFEKAPSNIGSVPLYVFSPTILEDLARIPLSPRGEYELQDAIQMLIQRGGNVRGFPLAGRRDLTKPRDLLDLNRHFLTNNAPQQKCHLERVEGNNVFIPPFYIEDEVSFGSNCEIGPVVYIERGSVIGDHVQLRDVVVLRNRVISSNTTAVNQIIW